jgi:F-type H+-transporting ATPase subunit b
MIAEAKEKQNIEYDRIITDAQSAIDQQKNAAITDVKNMIGKLVIEVAEKVIRRELVNRKDHEEYIRKMATDITHADHTAKKLIQYSEHLYLCRISWLPNVMPRL